MTTRSRFIVLAVLALGVLCDATAQEFRGMKPQMVGEAMSPLDAVAQASPSNGSQTRSTPGNLLGRRLLVPQQYATIQTAIDSAVHGDTVLVSDGTYYENIRFKGKRIVVASTFITTNDTSHISRTIINGSQANNLDSGSVVSFIHGEDTTSVLCGFTITGGTGTRFLFDYGSGSVWVTVGGGIFCENTGARIVRNIITRNRIVADLGSGGGIQAFGTRTSVPFVILEGNRVRDNAVYGTASAVFWNSSGGADLTGLAARIIDNVFERDSIVSATGGTGGGMAFTGYPSGLVRPIAIIAGNTFRLNYVSGMSVGAYGGGLDVTLAGNGTVIVRNLVVMNQAYSPVECYGGGICLSEAEATVAGNEIRGNSALSSAGAGAGGIGVDRSAVRIENNIIWGNTCTTRGGGVDVWDAPAYGSGQVLVNNTVCDNSAPNGNAMGVSHSARVISLNNIFWNSHATGGGIAVTNATVHMAYCDVIGGYTGSGNLDIDPRFVPGGTYRLSDSSNCIGAGSDSVQVGSVVVRAPTSCFYGTPRPSPGTSRPDIGACENLRGNPLVGVEEQLPSLPAMLVLSQNYPNPFNPSTTIRYSLPMRSHVKLAVYNTLGQQVAMLVQGEQEAGDHEVLFDGSGLASGVYFYRLQAGPYVQTKKLSILQ